MVTLSNRFRYTQTQAHNESPSAFGNDKFPSAGNELNRDKTKDHVVEWQQRKKNPATCHYPNKMAFFVSLLPLFIVVIFFWALEVSLCAFIQKSPTRESRNYLWWLRNCVLLIFRFFFRSFTAWIWYRSVEFHFTDLRNSSHFFLHSSVF